MLNQPRTVLPRSFVKWMYCAVAYVTLCTLLAPVTSADVTGEQVISGNVRFVRHGNRIRIYASDGSIINYNAFNIDSDQLVRFLQPGADARVLNRILGPGPTMIQGTLLANGNVFFANPAGVIFGANSIVNVGGIYAAAANISNTDFLNGVNQFTDASGAVINYGSIRGEAVHLIGRIVENHGAIVAPRGLVTMLAGDSAFIGEIGGNLLVRVDGRRINGNRRPVDGSTTPQRSGEAGVLNTGSIKAHHGSVVLGAGDLYSLGVHNVGSIRSNAGDIRIHAADGLVLNEGRISADARNQNAGRVTVRGPSVINGGKISADAWRGEAGYVEVTSQNYTYLLDESITSAQGRAGYAIGGEVLINSYQGLTFFSKGALVNVSGGIKGGDGGFAEISGRYLNFAGDVNLRARRRSSHGSLLIDPEDLHIVEDGNPNDNDLLTLDSEILFDEDGGAPNAPDAIIWASQIETIAQTATQIRLEATRDIFIEFQINLDPADNNIIVLNAGRHIDFQAPIIDAASIIATADAGFLGFDSDGIGNVIVQNGINLSVSDELSFNGISLDIGGNLFSTNTMTLNGPVNATANNLSFSGSTIEISNDLIAPDGISLNGMVDLTGGDQTIDAGLGTLAISDRIKKVGVGDMTLAGDTGITVGGDIIGNNGSITLDNDTSVLDDVRILTFNPSPGGRTLTVNGDLIFADNAGGTHVLRATDGIDISGNLLTQGGSGDSIVVNGDTTIGGNVTADQDLTFLDTVTFDGGTQLAEATNGTLRTNETLTKSGGDDLTLTAGTLIDINGLVAINDGSSLIVNGIADVEGNVSTEIGQGGDITFNNAVTLAGDVTADNDLTFNDTATFDGANVAQQAAATNGTLTGASAITKDNGGNLTLLAGTLVDADDTITVNDGGDLIVTGAADLEGDVITEIGQGGDITFNGGTATLAGDIDADGDVAFQDDVVFDGDSTNQDQSVTAGGVITSNGTIVRTDADAIAGNAIVGNLTLTANNANADQIAMQLGNALADTITIDNNLVLNSGAGNIDVDGHVDALNGSITVMDTSNFAGNVDADTDIDFQAEAIIAGNVDATNGFVNFEGTAEVGGDIDAGTDATFDSTLTIGGNVDAGNDATFTGAVTLNGGGGTTQELKAGNDLTAVDTVTKTTGGGINLEATNG
ncbi:MAG: filamentous hemagglutinin N-terminal domain-containing protein, partial [Planctomycetota bacterium]|nr:filamentous hemagglutinin N-terminal domain-containing protein [Planctomycetota bacterium]